MNSWYIQMAEGWKPGMCTICRADIGVFCTEKNKDNGTCPLSCATMNLYPINTGKVEGKTQKDRLANVLKDFKPHSTFELVRKVYGVNVATVARLASRVDDLRREGWVILAMKSKKQTNKWWYMATFTNHVQGNFGCGVGWNEYAANELMLAADAAAGEYE